MAVRDKILDGLAWAGITEEARVALISATLVRSLPHASDAHTQTAIQLAVRNTSPPYGRGKAITKAVTKEYLRQLRIYRARFSAQAEWNQWKAHQARLETRLNNVYAAAFNRPPLEPRKSYPGGWNNWEDRHNWDTAEAERDKGDQCIALTHQDDYIICLVTKENENRTPHIAVRQRGGGKIVRTYFDKSHPDFRTPDDLVQAEVALGGPKVHTALAKGKRVFTDWVGRRSLIYHDGSDFEAPKVEEVCWHISALVKNPNRNDWEPHYTPVPHTVLGDKLVRVGDD